MLPYISPRRCLSTPLRLTTSFVFIGSKARHRRPHFFRQSRQMPWDGLSLRPSSCAGIHWCRRVCPHQAHRIGEQQRNTRLLHAAKALMASQAISRHSGFTRSSVVRSVFTVQLPFSTRVCRTAWPRLSAVEFPPASKRAPRRTGNEFADARTLGKAATRCIAQR